MMHRRALWIVLAYVCAAVGQDPSGFSERAPRYKLQSSDTIQVQYRYTPEFNQTVVVQPDGTVSLQTAGAVKVSGLTTEAAAAAIATASKSRLRDPEVNIILVDYVKPYIVVAGEVGKPGRVEMRGRISVVEAIALAGGFKDSARNSRVLLLRKTSDDVAQVRVLDLKKLMSAGMLQEDFDLQSGDMLVVPKSRMVKVEEYVRIGSLGIYALGFALAH